MTKIFKRPLSILLAAMMVMSLFVAVPITASAAPPTTGGGGTGSEIGGIGVEVTPTTAAYVKVTSAPSDWSGDYLIVYEDGSKAFNGSAYELNSKGNYIDVTISDGEIESNAATDAAKVTIAQIDGGYSLATATGAYIGGVSGQNKLDSGSEAILNTISLEDDSAKIVSNTSTLLFNSTWDGFRYYKTASQKPVQLYKLTGGSAPAPETFKVYVKKLTGGTYTIENLTGGTTVAQLKEIIADQIDIPVTAQQRLVFAGKTIEDAKTLAEYNIGEESTIHLVIRSYTVTWLNYDNSELGTSNVAYGTTPSYGGETPEKAEDETNTYTFAGWSPEVTAVTGAATYTAQYTATPKTPEPETYTVTWKNGETTLETDTGVESGAAPSYGGAEPTKASDSDKHYTFSGWYDGTNTYGLSDTLPNVTADVTYTAQFTEDNHAYTLNPTFNWTQDANTGDWTCDTLTLSCSCGATQDTNVAGVLGATNVKCTADANGDFTYKISKKISGVTYEDTKTLDANGVVKSVTQLKAAAAKGGSWELGNDIDRVINVKCANGFVLDGKNYTVTRPDGNSNYPVFVAADKNVGFTLKNLTIDGVANTINGKPAIASSQKSGNSGDVINLDNVTITNWDFDASNNGVVLAWGQATVNMTNCNIDTDSDYDVWGGAASTVNVSGGEVGTVYLNGGTATAELTNGADVDNIVAFAGNTITADSGDNITPPADYKVKDNGDGTYSIVPKEYVVQIGTDKYESLAEAISAAQNGDTITILDDIDLGTSRINVKKSVNFDLGGKTITGSGNAIFVVYPNKTVSIENGTVENTATTSNHYTIVGNASTVNLGDGAKLAGGYQTYSGAAGAVLNVNEGSTIENTTSFGAAIYNNAVLNVNGGTIKAAVPITTLGTSGNGGYEINITAGTVESTDEIAIYHVNAGELNITGGTIKGGSEAAVYVKSGTTEISGGTITSDGEAVKYDSTGSGYAALDKIAISGGTFSNDVDIYAAPGFVGTQLSATTFGVKVDNSSPLNPLNKAASAVNDNNAFGLKIDYLMGTLLGVQKKDIAGTGTSANETGQDIRFVACLDTDLVQSADDYGFVLAKVSSHTYDTIHFENLRANAGNGEKTISCKGTYNNVCGNLAYGNPADGSTDYKYITCGVNGVTGSEKVVARFYVKINGTYYYAKYSGHNYQYTGCLVGWDDLV